MSILQYFVQFAFALPIFFVLLDNIRKYNVTNIALKEIPGPFFAKFTNLWRFVISLRGQGTTIQRKLHNKHGPVVRLGPTYVSLSDPAVISQIYSTKGDFIKSPRYSLAHILTPDHRLVELQFSTQNEVLHTDMRKPIGKLFSITSILTYEPLMDATIQKLIDKLAISYCEKEGQVCEIDKWIYYYAWDAVAEINFSKRIGFLDAGVDWQNSIKDSTKANDYFGAYGQIPFIDYFRRYIAPPAFDAPAAEAGQRMGSRLSGSDAVRAHPDFLDRFIEVMTTNSKTVTPEIVFTHVMSNITAGSDTIATTLCAMIYYMLKNPQVLKDLHIELAKANIRAPISWNTVQTLPFLDTVVQETLRIHPAVGVELERIVPPEGYTTPNGQHLPAGTMVGVNAWIVHHDKDVFGNDTEDFRPDRWSQGLSESVEAWHARRSKMRDSIFTFGAGKRVCMGKNLALVQLYKAAAALFVSFNMELADSNQEWKLVNGRPFFVRTSNINVLLSKR